MDGEKCTSFTLRYYDVTEQGWPEGLWKKGHIRTLSLAHCNIDNVPDDIRALHRLQRLTLDHNNVHTLPFSALLSLGHLQAITVTFNKLTDIPIPNPFLKMKSLTELKLSENAIGDVFDWPQLTPTSRDRGNECNTNSSRSNKDDTTASDSISDSNESGINCGDHSNSHRHNKCHLLLPSPQCDISAHQMTVLELAHCNLTHTPTCIFFLTRLKVLNLAGNGISSFLPVQQLQQQQPLKQMAHMCLPNLEDLDLSDNQLTAFPYAERGSSSVGEMLPQLRKLRLNNNNISFLHPDITSLHTQLKKFEADNNKIGSLELLVQMTALKTLRMNGNAISVIPNEISNLVQLENLNLSYNDITCLPHALLSLKVLKHLTLVGNNIEETKERKRVQGMLKLLPDLFFMVEDEFPDEIIPGIFLGSYLCAKSKHVLNRCRVTHILTVARGLEPQFPEVFQYHLVDVEDDPRENLRGKFPECHAFIDTGREAGGSVMVHCAAGVSRSATVVISYIMKTQKITLENAFQLVRQRRRVVCPNRGFMEQLKEYEAEIFSNG